MEQNEQKAIAIEYKQWDDLKELIVIVAKTESIHM